MRAFLVHRTPMRTEARKFIASLKTSHSLHIVPFFLRNSYGTKWKQQAESKIYSAEVVLIYDAEACGQSENTKWEIDKAKELGKSIIEFSREDITTRNVGALVSAYDFSNEFDVCFPTTTKNSDQILDLYKIMVNSSEQLIQRRQITNGFFITTIGAIIGATGFAVKEKIVTDNTAWVLLFPITIGLLMCRSWKNLIQNYGRLNTGKFKVIHKIEKRLSAKIFAAEWVALGKGLRKEKYQSFTSTEQNVPKLFSCLLWAVFVFTLFATDWPPIIAKVFDALAAGKEYANAVYQFLKAANATAP
jgi:hypothetical protein